MAYMTTYNLEWDLDPPTQQQVFEQITVLKDHIHPDSPQFQLAFDVTKEILAYGEEDPWYDCHLHMTIVSLTWPQTTFTLSGKGDDREDNWKAFYLAGKSHIVKAETVFPHFNPSDLRSRRPDPATTLEEKLEHLHRDIAGAVPPTSIETDAAVDLLRSLYGHCPDHLTIQYTGQDNITIAAGHHPTPNFTIILSPNGTAHTFINTDGKTTSRHHPNPTVIPSHPNLIRCLQAIREQPVLN